MAGDILLLSDASFVVKTIDLPAGISARDQGDFVDTSLEGFAPVSRDKLRRGFVVVDSCATVYVGVGSKIFPQLEPPKTVELVCPSLALFVLSKPGDGFYFLKGEGSLSLLWFDGGKLAGFWSVESEKDGSDCLREDLLSAAGDDDVDIPQNLRGAGVFKISSPKISGRRLKFVLECGNSKSEERSVPLKAAAFADVREQDFDAMALKRRRSEAAILWAYRAVAVAFGLLFMGQYYAWSLNSSVVKLSAQLGQLQPRAKEIEKISEESARLSTFTSDKIHSVETLARLNSMRPDEISFVRFLQTSPAELELFGKSPNLAAVDDFAKKLRTLEEIVSVDPSTERAAAGAKFSMKIKLKK